MLALMGSLTASSAAQSTRPAPATRPLDAEPVPLIHAFAHNDERHRRPLLDALDRGFCNIEVDVHLVDGSLLVGHSPWELKPEKTLTRLYLDPLRERIRSNGGRVFRDGPTVRLYLDFKTGAQQTYNALGELLKEYRPILTVFDADKTQPGAITIVITGNRPLEKMATEPIRYAACDGLLEDLDSRDLDRLVVAIGSEWKRSFKWNGRGAMPDDEKQKLREIVAKAHRQGKLLRFWGAPDAPAAWAELRAAGVDLINTDDLGGLQKFLLKKEPTPAAEHRMQPGGARFVISRR